MLDAARTRRADRMLDMILGGLSSVELACVTRDLEKFDVIHPLADGEIAIGAVGTFYVAVLLRRRGFYRCGDNGKSGLHREPVYSRGH